MLKNSTFSKKVSGGNRPLGYLVSELQNTHPRREAVGGT